MQELAENLSTFAITYTIFKWITFKCEIVKVYSVVKKLESNLNEPHNGSEIM